MNGNRRNLLAGSSNNPNAFNSFLNVGLGKENEMTKKHIGKHMGMITGKQMPIFTNINNIENLFLAKVNPRIPRTFSGVTKNYIYCYLDPFKPVTGPTDFQYNLDKRFFKDRIKFELTFGFEPFYIGKAVSSTGHRHNQHIAEFIKSFGYEEKATKSIVGGVGAGVSMTGKTPIKNGDYQNVVNRTKYNRMVEIQDKMKEMKSPLPNIYNTPLSWEEYQSLWVITLAEFDTREELEAAEKSIINTIGTLRNGRGPLTNISFSQTN